MHRKKENPMQANPANAVALRERFDVLYAEGRIDDIGEVFYAADAMLLPPDADPVRGRAAIVAYLKGLREQSGKGVFGVMRTTTEGNLAYIAGTASFPALGLDCVTLETYERQADGSWKCVVDMFHSRRPAAA
jgi:ketosteroid isomerase-like protein